MLPAEKRLKQALDLLDLHFQSFWGVAPFAKKTGHPVPMDTRGWSQLLVSILYGVRGIERRKGADLDDGSDVKGANTWEAIDTPRFNGVLKAGTLAEDSGKIQSLDKMPFLFFVLWDQTPEFHNLRCRIWAVRTQVDRLFRGICASWYEQRDLGTIRSNNFQLHPPRNINSNVFRSTQGNLEYPLYFCAERLPGKHTKFQTVLFDQSTLISGECKPA